VCSPAASAAAAACVCMVRCEFMRDLLRVLHLCQLEVNQMVEVIPLMDGEVSPRRVLCPWWAHPPASTLPAVARVTAGRFVRYEWLQAGVGRDVVY
jgi:hypothetical protein